jgi:hypothetical protein
VLDIDLSGVKGLAIAAVLGIGGAALVLATAWRPGKTADATTS